MIEEKCGLVVHNQTIVGFFVLHEALFFKKNFFLKIFFENRHTWDNPSQILYH